jgi:hypothetical protein
MGQPFVPCLAREQGPIEIRALESVIRIEWVWRSEARLVSDRRLGDELLFATEDLMTIAPPMGAVAKKHKVASIVYCIHMT